MRQVEELADRLVQYDRDFAAEVVQLIVDHLGGPQSNGEPNVGRAHSFLARADAAVSDEPTTTAQWKLEFAQRERLRQLGLRVTELLDQ